MKKSVIVLIYTIICLLTAKTMYAQSTIVVSGNIKNSQTKENLSAVSVTVKGSATGTFTDEKGNFRIVTTKKPPFAIIISSIGYATKEVNVESEGQVLNIELELGFVLGQEIVVAASRLPQRILESPVSIEHISTRDILQSPASSYYDVTQNLKGVDVVTSSLTFKSISTRGFNGSGNVRLNQIVDGMDNQAPGLNFSVGNVIGITDLDVDNMELLEGASSALYGPGGMNGTLLINSKSPFKYQGVSVQVREGIMNIDGKYRDPSPYHDVTLRWGQKISDKFAFKISGQYVWAKDWMAADSSNYMVNSDPTKSRPIPGTRTSDANYDGVNIYGDEISGDMYDVANGAVAAYTKGFIDFFHATYSADPTQEQITGYLSTDPGPSPFYNGLQQGIIHQGQNVSRTGYKESDVVPSNTINAKITGGLYYKIKPDLEASIVAYWGTGNSVYQGTDRYALKNLKIGQYKLELKSNNWFLRAYTTQENSGESYNATVTTQLFNEAWSPSINVWYPTYTAVYSEAIMGGASPDQANSIARATADANRPKPGSPEFNHIFDSVRLLPIPQGGRFLDRSDLYMVEGQYNLTDALHANVQGSPLEVLVGANFKSYVLNSEGTLFADTIGHPIYINEVGSYLQLSQKLFNDVLKLTASGRYDKNEYFKGRFTPRISAVISVAKNHNIRLSYQTAYRFPTTQNQWIDLVIGEGARLIGGLPQLREKYNFNANPVYSSESFLSGAPEVQKFDEYKPESSRSFELGYKGLINNNLLVDVYGYVSKYENFLGRIVVFQSSTTPGDSAGLANPKVFSVAVNSSAKVNTEGWGISLQYLLQHGFFINANVFSDQITNVPSGFLSYFNTPKYRYNLGFGNSGIDKAKRLAFNVTYRWQDAFFFESDFRQGNLPAFGTLDAQVSYKLSKQQLLFKLGGTNIINHYYRNAFGNPYIGGLYYISVAYNVF
ncbi:MAG: TonB-dependent receptor [Parafilimonas sp.]|nr:TonB-dependent receptor [Parafilimonas sp.]